MIPVREEDPYRPDLSQIAPDLRSRMEAAAEEVVEIANDLAANNRNVVSALFDPQTPFYEWQHYPKGDVFDPVTHAQFYYHSHNGEWEEHGHFHTFLRAGGMPENVRPVSHEGEDKQDWPEGKDALSHLIGFSIDHHGLPARLFTTNRWVTGETFYPAEDVIAMLDRFDMNVAGPFEQTGRWLSAMCLLFRPQVEALLCERDETVAARAKIYAPTGKDIYEDRGLEVTSACEISIMDQLQWLGLLED